jgi:hypothetical protein
MGSWVEIKIPGQRGIKRAKLKWKSSDNQKFLFVDQRGHKIKEAKILEVEEELANGSIKVLSTPSFSGGRQNRLGHGFNSYFGT